MIFVVVFGLLALQGLLYALFYKRQEKWIDFVVFGFFMLGNAWLFPWIINHYCSFHMENAGGMLDLLVLFAFWMVGLPVTILLFLLYERWKEKQR